MAKTRTRQLLYIIMKKRLIMKFLNGKEFSHNNIIDATAALNIAAEFYDVNAAVIN